MEDINAVCADDESVGAWPNLPQLTAKWRRSPALGTEKQADLLIRVNLQGRVLARHRLRTIRFTEGASSIQLCLEPPGAASETAEAFYTSNLPMQDFHPFLRHVVVVGHGHAL